ncbi:hypothetical protein JT06_10450 [Desulfobulbus sp. Tol-SR]|jgi:hypothetical protein|nr:hypothetical protein JT06_10450 [Desulfobulbus sp. Tol-SR]
MFRAAFPSLFIVDRSKFSITLSMRRIDQPLLSTVAHRPRHGRFLPQITSEEETAAGDAQQVICR